jgi:hypothetical protein
MWQRVGDHHRRHHQDIRSALKGIWIFLGERGCGGLHSLSSCAQPGILKRLPAEGDGRVVFCLAEEGGGAPRPPCRARGGLHYRRRDVGSALKSVWTSLRVSILP